MAVKFGNRLARDGDLKPVGDVLWFRLHDCLSCLVLHGAENFSGESIFFSCITMAK